MTTDVVEGEGNISEATAEARAKLQACVGVAGSEWVRETP